MPDKTELTALAGEVDDISQFIFDWFNERFPEEMYECLKAHTDREYRAKAGAQ